MVQLFLIGISAGAATALLFASVASGSMLSVLLFYLAPLPILIAATGWSHWAALIAAIVASASIAAIFGPYFFIAFLVGIGLPAWWLGYLSLLARPAPGGTEWYPVGHLVVWCAILSAALVITAILSIGTDEESFRSAMRSGLERMIRLPGGAPAQPSDGALPQSLADILIRYLPMAAGVLTTITSVVNLGLAARIVNMSGRLPRPWPDVSAMTFPTYAPVLIGAGVVGMFLPGLPGIAAGVLMMSMLMAYAVLGFAILHAITRGSGSRPFVLGAVYAAVIVFFWPAVVLSLLGLADSALDVRGRVARRRGGPPQPRT